MSCEPTTQETNDAPLPRRGPPEVLVVACDEDGGAGVFGSAHMGGEWVARYLNLNGELAREIRGIFGALGGCHLDAETARRVSKALGDLEVARNPALSR